MRDPPSSYLCAACCSCVATERRAQHERYWCETRCARFQTDASENVQKKVDTEATLGVHSFVEVELVGLPLRLRFEQQPADCPAGTGGSLWQSELLLAEWCLCELALAGAHAERSTPLKVLELACGAAPAAGLACISLGCNVLMTDLASVLSYTEANLRLNHDAVVAQRTLQALESGALDSSAGQSGGKHTLSRTACNTEVFEFGSKLPPRIVEQAPFDVVMCSDCLWQEELYEPLASALAAILAVSTATTPTPATRCVVAFQRRSYDEERFFTENCPRHGLRAEAAPIEGLLSTMKWPRTVSDGFPHGESLVSHFFITEVMAVR